MPARKAPYGGRGGRASGRLEPEDRGGLDAKFGRHPLARLVVVAQHVLRSRPTCDFLTQRLPVHACFKWPVPHPRAQIAAHVWGIVWTVFAGARAHKNPGSREIIRFLWRRAFLSCSGHCSQDLKRPRHPAGKNARQGPLVALPARAVRGAPPPARQRARRRLRACSWGGKGTSAGLAAPPGLRGASTWRPWQPYGARGRARWSGAAAGPHCRATRPGAPPPKAPSQMSLYRRKCLPFVPQCGQ